MSYFVFAQFFLYLRAWYFLHSVNLLPAACIVSISLWTSCSNFRLDGIYSCLVSFRPPLNSELVSFAVFTIDSNAKLLQLLTGFCSFKNNAKFWRFHDYVKTARMTRENAVIHVCRSKDTSKRLWRSAHRDRVPLG